MKVYMCNKCGYTGLPVGAEENSVYFLGCPNCEESFENMRLLGEYKGDEFHPKEDNIE